MANKVIIRTENYRIEGDFSNIGTIIRNDDNVKVATLQGGEYVSFLDTLDNAPEHMQDVLIDQFDM